MQLMEAKGMSHERFREKYGPWAVVTGASEGIGREFARRLGEAGFHLVLVARRAGVLEELADELRTSRAIQVKVLPADLSRQEEVDAIATRTAGLDVGLLVAAAGFGTSGRFVDSPLQDELAMIDVNCRAVAALAHPFGARFRRRGRGGIVLLSSVVAFQGVPRTAGYAATKAYVQSLAEGLRGELAPFGVDVIASAPGPIRSGFAERAGMRMGMAQTPQAVAQATLDALGRRGTVRPGWLSKLLGWSLGLLPRWARVRIMGVIMAGMTPEERPRDLPRAAGR
jgi:short-subunit dehydrogenase